MKAIEPISRAAIILNDDDPLYTRWSKPEMLGWLNDAAMEIVLRKPAARVVTEVMVLKEGILQSIPEGGIQLISVTRNIPGRAISKVSRRLLDDTDPNWHSSKQAKAVIHYMQDEMEFKEFAVYPPVGEGISIELSYSCPPPEVHSDEDELLLGREFMSPLVSFILYRALAKDSEFSNGQLAALHYQAFNEALGSAAAIALATKPEEGK